MRYSMQVLLTVMIVVLMAGAALQGRAAMSGAGKSQLLGLSSVTNFQCHHKLRHISDTARLQVLLRPPQAVVTPGEYDNAAKGLTTSFFDVLMVSPRKSSTFFPWL